MNMAVLSIVDCHKEDLNFLREQPAQISADFCKLAWSFLTKGTNLKMYQTAAQKLQVDTKQILSGVEGLANLFIEMGKIQLKEEEFKETMTNLGFSEDSCCIIYSEYMNQRKILEVILPHIRIQHPQFRNLEWRFDTLVSSRSVKSEIQPSVLIKLDLEQQGEIRSHCFQSNIPNIIHLNQVINQAVQDSKTQHCKRIQRAVA